MGIWDWIKGINELRGEVFGWLMITHYKRFLNYITPVLFHVMMSGRIFKSGGPALAQLLGAVGYDLINKEVCSEGK